jgi:hypothetical protein
LFLGYQQLACFSRLRYSHQHGADRARPAIEGELAYV